MADDPIKVGDRVINLQVPGVFVVVARRGRVLEIESPEGVAMTVFEGAVRRLDGGAASSDA